MLVLTRLRDEKTMIGDERTTHARLSDEEMSLLRDCADPRLIPLANRLLLNLGALPVTLVDVRGEKARIGFDAPVEIPIHRKEVADAIARGAKRSVESDEVGLV